MKGIIPVLLVFFLFSLVSQAAGEGRRLTASKARPQSFDVDGNLVVWADERLGYDGDLDIFLMDLRTGKEQQLTKGSGGQFGPRISGQKVVWFDYRNKNADIYIKDLKTGQTKGITKDKRDQVYPDIEGNWVVWIEKFTAGQNLYLYSLANGKTKKITLSPWESIYQVRIAGQKIAWWGKPKGESPGKIFSIYDIKTGKISHPLVKPAIAFAFNGRYIAWDENRVGSQDIYLYDLNNGKERRLTRHPANQFCPDINGEKLIWFDDRNNQMDLYQWDLMEEKIMPVKVGPGEKKEPRLWGDRVVWISYPEGSDKLRGSQGLFYKRIK